MDEERGVVRTEAVYRMPPDELGAEVPPGVGLAGRVLLTQQPIVLDRYGDVENPTQMGMLENAVIGMPIFWPRLSIRDDGVGRAEALGGAVRILAVSGEGTTVEVTIPAKEERSSWDHRSVF